jgi:hypothetical protein
MAQLRSSKRLQLAARDGQPAEEINGAAVGQGNGAGAQQGTAAGGQDIAAAENDNGAAAEDMTHADDDIVACEEVTEGKLYFICHLNISSLFLICKKLSI